MDRNKVETAIRLLEKYRNDIWTMGNHVEFPILDAIIALKAALRKPQSDPCDECECEGCRAKTDDDVQAEAFPPDSASEDFGPCGPLEIKPVQFTFHNDQPSDYEIRLKAWESVQGFWFPDESEFSEAFAAATKLYNFLSGQNEDTK